MLPTTSQRLLKVSSEWVKSLAFRQWLSGRRWFPHGRKASTEVRDSLLLKSSREGISGILILRASGDDYQLPLFLTRARPGSKDFITLTVETEEVYLQEGERSRSYCTGLLQLVADGAVLKTARDRSVRFQGPSLVAVSPPRPVTQGKSTNISVVVEDASGPILLKSFRKVVRAGREPVLLDFLTGQGYDGAPKLLGSVALDDAYLMEILSFRPAEGDLGEHVMAEVAPLNTVGTMTTPSGLLEGLGASLAGLHRALGASDDPRFAPETLTESQLENQIRRGLGYYTDSRNMIVEADPPLGELIGLLEAREGAIRSGLEDLRRAEGWPSIHIHDDLHLAQVLVSGGELFFVDFEGEPLRPADGVWERNSPLRDLATLLRSLSYVKHAAWRQAWGPRARERELELASGPARGEGLDRLSSWEVLQRETLSNAYLEALRKEAPELLPEDEAEVPILVEAWELEKALYELEYEILYRPDYALIPLSALPFEK